MKTKVASLQIYLTQVPFYGKVTGAASALKKELGSNHLFARKRNFTTLLYVAAAVFDFQNIRVVHHI